MKRVNKIFLTFIALVVLSFWGLWRAIQTEKFGAFVSAKIVKALSEDVGLDIHFDRIEMKLLPPSTILRSVKIEEKGASKFTLEADVVGASFGISDIFSHNLSIGKIFVENAVVNTFIKESKKESDFRFEQLFTEYQKAYGQLKKTLRLKKIGLDKIQIVNNEFEVFIDTLSASLYSDIYTVEGALENITWGDSEYNSIELIKVDGFVNKEGLRLKKLEIFDMLEKVSVQGLFGFDEANSLSLKGQFSGGKNTKLLSLIKSDKFEIDKYDGFINIGTKVTGSLKSPVVDGVVELENFVSPHVLIDYAKLNVELQEEVLTLKKLYVKKGRGEAFVDDSYPLINIENKKILTKKIKARTNKIFSNDFLYTIREDLAPLKFYLTGFVNITLEKESVRFEPMTGAMIENLKLYNKRGNTIILSPEDIEWIGGKGVSVLFTTGVLIDGKTKIDDSEIEFKGRIDDRIDIQALATNLSLERVGPISGTSFKGRGKVELHVNGPARDVKFDGKYLINDFSIIGMNLGQMVGTASYLLEDEKLLLNVKQATYKDTNYLGKGVVHFDGDSNLDLQVKIINGSYISLEEMLPNVFSGIKQYTKYLNAYFKGNVDVFGGFKDSLLGVKGKVLGGGEYLNESIDKFKFSFKYLNQQLNLKNILMEKVKGKVRGNAWFDFKADQNKYNFTVNKILLRNSQNLTKIGFGYDGELSGFIKGGEDKNIFLDGEMKIINGRIGRIPVKDSLLNFYRKRDNYVFRANIFENEMIIDSLVDLNKKNRKESSLKLKVNNNDLRKIFGAISLHNLEDKSLSGNVSLESNFFFDPYNYLASDIDVDIKNFELMKSGQKLTFEKNSKIKIENGKVLKWNLNVANKDGHINSMANGSFKNKIQVNSNFRIPAVFANLISDKVSIYEGELRGTARLIGEDEKFITYLELDGDKLSAKIKGVQNNLSNVNFKIIVDRDRLVLNDYFANMGGGVIRANGVGTLTVPFPELKIFIEASDIRIPMYKKSYLIADANLSLAGNDLPYVVSGNAVVKKSEIRDELKDMKSDTDVNQGYRKFVPRTASLREKTFVKLDIDSIIKNPVEVKNSFLEAQLVGKVKMVNKLTRPLYRGELELPAGKNILYLKGHEFNFDFGRISMLEDREEQIVNLDFLAMSKINEYDVFTAVKGEVSDVKVDMYSRPELSQGDLLSLITLGVTNDISQNLGEKERESVTTLGIGGLVLDQLGVNQNLNKSFGLKLSVSPDIEEDEGSLLKGRVENSGEETSMKTGTKIQVKKSLAEKVGLSLSSTVGGAAKQKNEMNVDVKINESFSLEGVYEVKSTDELEEENPESIGADLKWRFSF